MHSWLRHCATSRKVASSIPIGAVGNFYWHNPLGRTTDIRLTQPLTEMSTRNISWGWRRPVCRADNVITFMCWMSWNLGDSTCWNPQGLSRPVMGLLCLCLFVLTGFFTNAVKMHIDRALITYVTEVYVLCTEKYDSIIRPNLQEACKAHLWTTDTFTAHVQQACQLRTIISKGEVCCWIWLYTEPSIQMSDIRLQPFCQTRDRQTFKFSSKVYHDNKLSLFTCKQNSYRPLCSVSVHTSFYELRFSWKWQCVTWLY